MPKLDDAMRDAILQEKSSLTNKQLQDKYGVSRSTIQRIKLPDLESRVSEFTAESRAPDTAKQDFADKFVKTLLEEDYFHLINTTWNKSSIKLKLMIGFVILLTILGLLSLIKIISSKISIKS